MRDYVVFKGSRNGLQLVFDESAEFEVILEQLKNKLESAIDFFSVGASVQAPAAPKVLSVEQQEDLSRLLAAYGLVYKEPELMEEHSVTAQEEAAEQMETLVVARTLRGGQEIVHKGSVIIVGDVNPGAEVVAGGDILIKGTCRGVVHAGACGNMQATITANKMVASQIRIAGLIARAPDNLEKPMSAEQARLKDGCVIIEPVDIQEGLHG